MHLLRRDEADLQVLLGEPKRAVRSMFIPFLVAFAIVEANQFVDTFWISGLGTSSAEAISASIPFYLLLMSVGVGVSVGATTTIAFRLGRSETVEASKLASNSLMLGIILSLISSIALFLLLGPAIGVLGLDSISDEIWNYMLPMIVMAVPIVSLTILGGVLRGEGAARKSTVIQISAAAFNMLLDPLMIYGLGLDILGAGLATGVSALVSLAIGLSWYARGKTVLRISMSGMRPDRPMMAEVLNVAGPRTANELIASAMTFIQRIFFVVAGGPAAVMIYNYPWRFISLFNLPGKAFENSLVPVGSAAYGQSDTDKMWAAYVYCLKIMIVVSLVAVVIIYVFAEPLMSIMTYESSMHEKLPELVWALRTAVFLLPFMSVRGLGASLLQSMKRAKVPMYFDLMSGSARMMLYALSAYGFLWMDPFEGIIYIMVVVYAFNGIAMSALAVWQFRKIRSRIRAAEA